MQQQLTELRELYSKWKGLSEHAGFELLEHYAQRQIDKRVGELCDPEHKPVNFTRGEIAGIHLFARIPRYELERLRDEIDNLAQKVESQEEGNET